MNLGFPCTIYLTPSRTRTLTHLLLNPVSNRSAHREFNINFLEGLSRAAIIRAPARHEHRRQRLLLLPLLIVRQGTLISTLPTCPPRSVFACMNAKPTNALAIRF